MKEIDMRAARAFIPFVLVTMALGPAERLLSAQAEPAYLRDRGPGVRTSVLGSYVRQGELLAYPFYEYYRDHNLEYKPLELGYGGSRVDYRGRYHANEGIMFFAYGVTRDLALEFEGAVISAEIQTSPDDTSSARPARMRESGLGDVEGQIRWRFQRETENRPELFTYFGTVFPLQKSRRIIGTQHWEHFFGIGLTRGFRWGTLTVRTAAEYSQGVFDAGEYAIEWLKRLSPAWRVVAGIEGNQVDEISLLTEIQWGMGPHATVKLNNALGLTPNATDFAPEVGIMFSF